MERLFEIVLFLAGLFLLWLTYRMYRKEWKAPTWICALFALLARLGTQEWVQGFFKTGILSLGYEYGDRLDNYQKTVGKIETTVRRHQDVLNRQQEELAQQQLKITTAQEQIEAQQSVLAKLQQDVSELQSSLNSQHQQLQRTQTEISKQQSQIEEVEFLVQNLFSKTKRETFSSFDSNRVCYVQHGDGAIQIFFKLKEPAIINSIRGYFDNTPMKPGINHIANVAWTIFVGDWNQWKKSEYYFTYVADTRSGQKFDKMEVRDEKVYLDGRLLSIDYVNKEVNIVVDSDKE